MAKRDGNLNTNSRKLTELRAALASDDDPLGQFREAMPEGSPEQNVVVYVFGALLDTNSEGLPSLLERFDSSELDIVCAGLRVVGATETLTDLHALRNAMAEALKPGGQLLDASGHVIESEMGRAMTKKYEMHVTEMENKLLEFCRENIEVLARE